MKTIEYHLESKPGERIKLPEGTLAHVRRFFFLAKSASNERTLMERLNADDYFKEMNLFLQEDLIHMNYRFKKYRMSKYKDRIYGLIGNFELSNCYNKLGEVEKKLEKALNFLED
jgi:hypothetical protein